ncbi:MAG: hypothetical protein EBR81_13990, partial [Proteobacteria bacterium]|nr:hypothetical protein [Pseudomonadota bacterium]
SGGTISVDSPAVTATLGSTLSGTYAFTKTGDGILALGNPASTSTGTITVSSGILAVGAANGLSRFARIDLGPNGTFDVNNTGALIGSLSGTGLLANRGAGQTLRIGFDNTDFTFSGRFASTSQVGATLNIDKIGTGTMTVDSAAGTGSYNLGGLTVSQGTFKLSGAAGSTTFGTYTVPTGGLLLLDNSVSNLNNRLGGPNRNITMQGGELKIIGNASAPTVESLFSPNISAGSTLNRANGMSTLTLVPNASQPLSLNVGAIQALAGADGLLVRGTNLGATPGNGVATLNAIAANFQAAAQTGAGTPTMYMRPDIIADTSATGTGTGFATWLPNVGVRPLTAAELAPGLYRMLSANVNLGVTASQLLGTTTAYSLTLNTGGALTAISNAVTFTDTSGGFLTLANGASSINGGLYQSAGNQMIFQQLDATTALDFNAYILTLNQVVKNGVGTLNLLKPQLTQNSGAGIWNVNQGVLALASGVDNTIPVIATATTPYMPTLVMNGGSLDLKGNSQAIGALSSQNQLPGLGGNIINSTGTLAIFTVAGGGVYSGAISGSLGFTRSGNNTTTLTNTNTFTGPTIIRGGVLELRDKGTLSNTSALTDYFGTLQLNDQGLYSNVGTTTVTRLNTGTLLTLAGATLN